MAVFRHLVDRLEAQNTRRLCHRLDDQYTGHDGVPGEMAIKERLIAGHVLVGHNRFTQLQLGDPVYQQKRVAMGKVFTNFVYIHYHA